MGGLANKLARLAEAKGVPFNQIYAVERGVLSRATVIPGHRVNNIYSVSKSFTAIAVGMLVDRGMLKMTDTVYDILSPKVADCPEVWRQVTVDILISQRTGVARMFLDFDEDDLEDYGTDDLLSYALARPMDTVPGERFGYSDSNFYIASCVVEAVAGMPLHEFLGREMFAPMGFQAWSWAVCPKGHTAGGTGLSISCKDMLKFGILLKDLGVYDGRRYVSEEWMREATTPHAKEADPRRYGWGLWLPADTDAVMCTGAFGQIIFADKERDIAVAWQAFDPEYKQNEILEQLVRDAK